MSMADVGGGGEEAVVTFDTITILTPRYRTTCACLCQPLVFFVLFQGTYSQSLLIVGADIMSNFTFRFCGFKGKPLILKSSTAALFEFLYCLRFFFDPPFTILLPGITHQKISHTLLMQSNQPHTFVVVTLDPPIRKGQTLYPHIVMQVPLLHCFSDILYQSLSCIEKSFVYVDAV